MNIFILREGSQDKGTAFNRFREAAAAAANMTYAEILRATFRQQGAALNCDLFNRNLGNDARIVAVVRDGQTMVLNQKLAPQEAYSCPGGHVKGVIAPAGTLLRCGDCQLPLTSG